MRIVPCLVLAGVLAWGAAAVADIPPSDAARLRLRQFKALDTNNDGAISTAEWQALPRNRLTDRLFRLLETGDGKISIMTIRRRGNAALASRLKALDTDGDGSVSRAEFKEKSVPLILAALDPGHTGRVELAQFDPAFQRKPIPAPEEVEPPRKPVQKQPNCWMPFMAESGGFVMMPMITTGCPTTWPK